MEARDDVGGHPAGHGIARDDRPWGGPDLRAMVYLYAPGRGAEHAIRPHAGFSGILQVDANAAYKALADPAREAVR